MRTPTLYLDTSTIGGYFDDKWKDATQELWRQMEAGQWKFVTSTTAVAELEQAPERVRELFKTSFEPENVFDVTDEMDELAAAYVAHGVVPPKYQDDARHVAACTICQAGYAGTVTNPGTLSAAPRTYLDLLEGLAENFLKHGFRRLVFLNGHGGNDVPGRQAVFELRQKHRDRSDLLLLLATYWSLGARPWESDPAIEQREMGHACEWETSMILRLDPRLVGDHRAVPPVPFGKGFEPAVRGWVTQDRSVPGHIGSPHLATTEKGEALFRAFSADVEALLGRMIAWDGRSWNG
jgi:creatinine amidohydrolase